MEYYRVVVADMLGPQTLFILATCPWHAREQLAPRLRAESALTIVSVTRES